MMKTYAKPMILANDELAEGVYAASGDGCWTVEHTNTQNLDDRQNGRFHFLATHNADHATEHYVITVYFDQPITGVADGNNGATASGSSVIFTIDQHANGHDNRDLYVAVQCANPANVSYTGRYSVNCTHG